MFNYGAQRVEVWGVMNLTPDSFSDGGELSALTQVEKRFQTWAPWVDALDIGAESTNPWATAITDTEEKSRLQSRLLPLLKQWPLSIQLSVDTYKPAVMEWLLPYIPADVRVFWNDVSGQLDDEVLALMERYPQLHYVLCHNLVTQRDQSGRHMEYVTAGPITPRVESFFKEAHDFCESHQITPRVMVDPCFGFAKTREQNLELMQELPSLMDRSLWREWLWGLSRKSFLRAPDANPHDLLIQAALDQEHVIWLKKTLKYPRARHTIRIRTHAPERLVKMTHDI